MADVDLDQLQKDQLVERLADVGLSPEIIAYAVNQPLSRVRGVVSVRRFTPGPITEQDQLLQDEAKKLAVFAIRKSFMWLEFGSFEQQAIVMRAMLSAVGRSINATTSGETQETRVALEQLFKSMSGEADPSAPAFSTEDDPNAFHVAVATASEPADNQD